MKNAIFTLGCLIISTGFCWADTSVTILKGQAAASNQGALYLDAVDETGKPISGLTKDNFRLEIGGREVEVVVVEPVSTADEPVSIVLGLDISGSMKGRPFRETKRALSVFLDQLEKTDYVSLISFGAEVVVRSGFVQEKYKLREQIDSLEAEDMWTHLYEATYASIELGKTSPTVRNAVILLTDGRDEGSAIERRRPVEFAQSASIPVFTIGFGNNIDREYLNEISHLSGGCALYTPEAEKIAELYNQVLERLKKQYVLYFDFDKNPGNYKANLTLLLDGK